MENSRPNPSKLIDRFIAEPQDPEVQEVLPLVPVEQIRSAIEKRYGLSCRELRVMSYEGLAAVVETYETLCQGNLEPSKYDFDSWFGGGQVALDGWSPRQLILRGEFDRLREFAEHTVAQVKKLG